MHTSIDQYLIYILSQFEYNSGVKGVMYTPYETIYQITSPHAFHTSSVRHAVNSLERKGYLEKMSRQQVSLFTLTRSGHDLAASQFATILDSDDRNTVTVPEFWWQILFDVPEKKRAIRDSLRSFLTDSGFIMWQKSVYLFPGNTPKDTMMTEMFAGTRWEPYVSILKVQQANANTDLLKICRNVWNIDKIYVDQTTLVQKAQDVSSQITKKALNSHQKAALQKEGQTTALAIFQLIMKLNGIPRIVFKQKPHGKLVTAFYQLTSKLTSLD